MFPALKKNAAAGYQGPVKIEVLKGAGLLPTCIIEYPLGRGGGVGGKHKDLLIGT